MARVVQANLVFLRTVDARRRGIRPEAHEIRVPPPGAVRRFRECLLERKRVTAYSDFAVRLRLHEIWGQYCLMSWLLAGEGEALARDLSRVPDSIPSRCVPEIEIKTAEVHAMLWRLRFEQRRRTDTTFRDSPEFDRLQTLARRIPLTPFGKSVDACTDDDFLLSACEHAGMLAVLRWAADRTRDWGDPALMNVADEPFALDAGVDTEHPT